MRERKRKREKGRHFPYLVSMENIRDLEETNFCPSPNYLYLFIVEKEGPQNLACPNWVKEEKDKILASQSQNNTR